MFEFQLIQLTDIGFNPPLKPNIFTENQCIGLTIKKQLSEKFELSLQKSNMFKKEEKKKSSLPLKDSETKTQKNKLYTNLFS